MNINQITNYNVQFKGINLASGSKNTLRKVLSRADKVEFADLYMAQRKNYHTEIDLFGNDGKITASIWEIEHNSCGERRQHFVAEYSPYFWQSSMSVIRKACKRADKLEQEIASRPSVATFDEILGKN